MKAWKRDNVYYIAVEPCDILKKADTAPVTSTGASLRQQREKHSTVISQRVASGVVTLLLMGLAIIIFCITHQR